MDPLTSKLITKVVTGAIITFSIGWLKSRRKEVNAGPDGWTSMRAPLIYLVPLGFSAVASLGLAYIYFVADNLMRTKSDSWAVLGMLLFFGGGSLLMAIPVFGFRLRWHGDEFVVTRAFRSAIHRTFGEIVSTRRQPTLGYYKVFFDDGTKFGVPDQMLGMEQFSARVEQALSERRANSPSALAPSPDRIWR